MKTAVIVCAVVAGAVALAWLVVHSKVTIALTVAASLLAVALNHPVEWLQRHGFKRWPAIASVLFGAVLVLAGIFGAIIPAAVSQVQQMIRGAPEAYERLRHTGAFQWLDERVDIQRRVEQFGGGKSGTLQQAFDPVIQALTGVVGALAAAVTILFLVIFMLGYGGRLICGFLAEALPVHRERYERVLGNIYRTVGGYLSGLALIATLNATMATTVLAILRVPFFLPLGILSGMGSLVPLVGITVAGLIITAIALASGGLWVGIAVGSYVILYQQFENHVVAPVVYRRTVKLNPLVTLLGIILLAEIFGVVGAFLAVPTIAVAQIVLRELLILRRERLGLPLEGSVAEHARRHVRFWRKPRPA
ncbi:MAG: AI-2E family transporter [Myxococcaceae bacterium]